MNQFYQNFNMTKEEIIEKLKNDEHYYGEFGKNFLSNSILSFKDDVI